MTGENELEIHNGHTVSVTSHSELTDSSCITDNMSQRSIILTRHLSPGLTITCASAPQSRSSSFKNRPRPRDLDRLDQQRRNSMPAPSPNHLSVSFNDLSNDRVTGHPLRRVRSFKTTSKGALVNHGDSFRKSTNSVMSGGSAVISDIVHEQYDPNIQRQVRSPSDVSEASTAYSIASSTSPSFYQVAMLGHEGVGISSLVSQFMTSEYIGGDDSDEEDEEKMVSVLLDCEESTMEFVEEKEIIDEYNIDAYVITFSITDRKTLQTAMEITRRLRQDQDSDRPIILVANKCDLVRKRQVTATEAKQLATHFDCKYIETSVVLNHNIDELLVGVLKQIRLKLDPETNQESLKFSTNTSNKVKRDSLSKPKELLRKIFGKHSKSTKSCDNLYAL